MKTPILLHIPEPCHENWDAMTQKEKGKYCQSCNKIVIDFSVMSDRQVIEYFKKTTGKTCGRFNNDQLQRPIVEPQQKPSKWNYLIASIIGFFMTGKLVAQDKMLLGKVARKPAMQSCVAKGETVEVKKDTNHIKTVGDTIVTEEVFVNIPMGSIKITPFTGSEAIMNNRKIIGKIIDEKGSVIGGATITIKGTRLGTASDFNGAFELKKLGASKLIIVVSSISFETKEINVIPKELKGDLVIVLKENKNELNEVLVETNYTTRHHTAGGLMSIKCFRYKELAPLIVQKIFNKESIKIYPNPARRNDIIHITIKDAGEYALHFFDTQSRLLNVKSIVTNTNNQTTEFQLPSSVVTGSYFIRILNEKTQKQVTEKIIVQ